MNYLLVTWSHLLLHWVTRSPYITWLWIKEIYRRVAHPHTVRISYGGGRLALVVNDHVVAVEGDECHDIRLGECRSVSSYDVNRLSIELQLNASQVRQLGDLERKAMQGYHKVVWTARALHGVLDNAASPDPRQPFTTRTHGEQPDCEAPGWVQGLRDRLADIRYRYSRHFHR